MYRIIREDTKFKLHHYTCQANPADCVIVMLELYNS